MIKFEIKKFVLENRSTENLYELHRNFNNTRSDQLEAENTATSKFLQYFGTLKELYN